MRTKKYFRAHENIFLCTEISLLAEEKIGAFGRRKISFRKEENFRICENFPPYIRRIFALGKRRQWLGENKGY